MAELIAEFFQIIGADVTPPETFAELVPYLLTILVGLCLVCGVFAVIGRMVNCVLDFTRWR